MEQKKFRREKGTGSVFQKPDGSWIGRISIGKRADGKPKMKYFSGRTEAEVKKKIRDFIKTNNGADYKKVSLEEYLNNWLSVYKRAELKNTSYDRLESTARNHVIPNFGYLQMADITADDIQPFFTNARNSGLSYSSVKKIYDCLNSMFNFATARDDIRKNPMLLVTKPKSEHYSKDEIRFFTEKESKRISEECGRQYATGRLVYPYGDAFILIQNTGLRMGEMIGLEKRDVDFENKKLHVRGNMVPVRNRDKNGNLLPGSTMAFDSTKTYSGERYIPLNNTALETAKRLVENSNTQYLISTETGKPVQNTRLERSFYRLLKNCGIEQAGLHSLRHTFASSLFAKGIDIKTISTLLGHASVQITINTYIHLIAGADHNAVKVLEEKMEKSTQT